MMQSRLFCVANFRTLLWVGFLDENPKIVAGGVATWTEEGESEPLLLLCRRAIEPRLGYWNLPAGYMEKDETTEEAAVREAMEEAGASIKPEGLLAMYDIKHIGQV